MKLKSKLDFYTTVHLEKDPGNFADCKFNAVLDITML